MKVQGKIKKPYNMTKTVASVIKFKFGMIETQPLIELNFGMIEKEIASIVNTKFGIQESLILIQPQLIKKQ